MASMRGSSFVQTPQLRTIGFVRLFGKVAALASVVLLKKFPLSGMRSGCDPELDLQHVIRISYNVRMLISIF
jgi:hypothetical protein